MAKRFTAEEQRLKKCERERLRRLREPEKMKARDAAYKLRKGDEIRAQQREYYALNSKRIKDRAKKFYEENREKCLVKNRENYHQKKDIISKNQKAYREKNAKKLNEARLRRYHSNPRTKIAVSIRNRINKLFKGRVRPTNKMALLGCSYAEAMAYIESLFKPGMTWKNWSYRGWHLDHKKPLICFDLTDPKQLAEACHYTNLQPLWMKENLSKSRKPQHPGLSAVTA